MPGMVLSFRGNVYTHIYTLYTQLYDKVNLMEQGETVELGPQLSYKPTNSSF